MDVWVSCCIGACKDGSFEVGMELIGAFADEGQDIASDSTTMGPGVVDNNLSGSCTFVRADT